MIIENYRPNGELLWDDFIEKKYSLFLDAKDELFISCAFAEEKLGIKIWDHPKRYEFHLCQDESVGAVKVKDLIKEMDAKEILLLVAECNVYKL